MARVPATTSSKQLRELERDDIVRRAAYAEVPPRVEYSLTETGRSLRGIAVALETWGREYRDTHAGSDGRAAAG